MDSNAHTATALLFVKRSPYSVPTQEPLARDYLLAELARRVLEGFHSNCGPCASSPGNQYWKKSRKNRAFFISESDRNQDSVRVGTPAAPGGALLPLLPLGPDGFRKSPPRRTHPDAIAQLTSQTKGCQCAHASATGCTLKMSR